MVSSPHREGMGAPELARACYVPQSSLLEITQGGGVRFLGDWEVVTTKVPLKD